MVDGLAQLIVVSFGDGKILMQKLIERKSLIGEAKQIRQPQFQLGLNSFLGDLYEMRPRINLS